MRKKFTSLLAAAAACVAFTTPAHAGSTDWVSGDAFYEAIAPFLNDWMEPADLAVRVKNGQAEYKMSFGPDTGPYSFNVYPTTSRGEADELIQMHAEAENLIGGPSRLCLHKFARATDGAKQYYLLYLVDGETSGLRCISLPKE